MLSDPGFTELTQQMEALSHSPEGTEATLDKEFGSDAKAVEEFAREWLEAVSALDNASRAVDDGVLFTTRSRLGALMQSSLAERVADTGTWRIGQHGGVEGHELKFSKNDWWGWSKSFFSWVTKTNYHAMLRPANAIPDPLPDNARIAVFSDWGTGLYGAPHIADAIRREGGFDVVMHLGDVYYAGTETEMRKRFLNVWPFGAGTQNRGLNSNHDMYSGGHAYFGLVLPTFNQTSSYFAIQNAHWTLVCLDTAYKDFDLDAEQITWIQNVLEQAGARKVVFFSHHQLFSRLDEQGDKLVRGLQSILEARRVYYWYWGHEHRCIVYDAHEAWGLRGRCVGHGGMPQKRGSLKDAATARRADIYAWKRLGGNGDVPGSHALDGPNVHIPEKEEEYLPHGYVILELDGGSLREIYMSADGKQLSLDGLDSA